VERPPRALIEREVLRLLHAVGCEFPADLGMESEWGAVWDSLDEIDFVLRVELEFDISLPDFPSSGVQREIWERRPFRLRDFVDLIEVQWGTGCPGEPRCGECGYGLAGVPPGRCPECGAAFRRLFVQGE